MSLTTDIFTVTRCHRYDGSPLSSTEFWCQSFEWDEQSKSRVAGKVAALFARSEAKFEDFTDFDEGLTHKYLVRPLRLADNYDPVRVIVHLELELIADDHSGFTERQWNEEA